MTKNQSVRNVGRSFISLLLAYSCLIMPMTGRVRALSFSSNAGDGQPNALRREAGKSPDARGIQFKSLPLRFELNAGQTDPQVRFIARSQSGDVFLTPREMVLCVRETPPSQVKNSGLWPQSAKPTQAESNRAVIRLQTVNANPAPRITGLDPLPGKTNYFIGNDPKKWRTNIPSYAKVKYENIYPGIDLIYYDNAGNIEYDFNVSAGADPSRIALSVEGADSVHIDEAGDLVLRTAVGEVRQHAPRIYQEVNGRRQEIAGGYKLLETSPAIQNPKSKIQNQLVAFDLASYDAGKPLVIDPEVVFATYFGGSSETVIHAIAVDASGSVYVAGHTFSHDFPTKNPLQATNNHSQSLSAIITKFSPDGASLVYSTYLGGSTNFALDTAIGIALDSSGAAYVTGDTGSTDFPTRNPIQAALTAGSGDLFISKISADGASLLYSTYLGGSGFDEPKGIVLDSSNSAYVYGRTQSTDFPTVSPTQATSGGSSDGFWSVISPAGSQLLFSTYFGGNGDDTMTSLDIDAATGDVYTGGTSDSTNIQGSTASVTPQADTPNLNRLLAKWRRNGRFDQWQLQTPIEIVVILSLFSVDEQVLIRILKEERNAIDKYLEEDEDDFRAEIPGPPSTQGVQPRATSPADIRLTLRDSNLKSTKVVFFGGNRADYPRGLARDSQGTTYIAGDTNSTDLPTVNPVQGTFGGGSADAFVAVFAPDTFAVVFATYLGGSGADNVKGLALDPQGNIYIAGQTQSPNFPTKNAFQPTPPAPNGAQQGQGNSFIVKLSAIAPIPTGPDFALGFDSPTVTAQTGTKAKIKININRTGGFTGNVTVTPAFPGQGVKPKPAAEIATTDSSVTFKYKTANAVPGQYPLTFTGKDDSGKTRTATVTLILQ